MDIDELERIIRILKQHDVTEFELIEDGKTIKLARAGSSMPGSVHAIHKLEPAVVEFTNGLVTSDTNAVKGKSEVPPEWVKVSSPIVGTFYGRPSPEADPFVKEGKVVKKGETLCIVEAMKLMNEIEAPESGKIEKVLLTDGQVVEFGEALFFINPRA